MRGLRPETPPELEWQPPEGTSWADLPSGSRLEQALTECVEVKARADRRLDEQLAQLDRARSRKYVARTQALAAVDPFSSICEPAVLRTTADCIVASYASRPGTEGGTPNANAPTTATEHSEREARTRPPRTPFTEHPLVHSIDARFSDTTNSRARKQASAVGVRPS